MATIILMAELIAAAVLSIAVFLHERKTISRAFDTAIRGRCDSLIGAVQDAEDAGDHVFVDPAELRLPAPDRWAVFNVNGSMVGRSEGAEDLHPMLERADGMREQEIDGVPFRLLQLHALRIIDREETGGEGIRRPFILVYASPGAHLVREALRSASYYIVATLVVSGITALLVAMFLRSSLQPIFELSTAAEELTLEHLEFTPPVSIQNISELRPLATTLSKVVQKLREAFVREQQFVGDAAHELKTSVAVIRSTIQVLMLKSRTPEEYRTGLNRALEDTERLELLVQQMLRLTRMEEEQEMDSVRSDLSVAAEAARLQLLPVSQHAGIDVTCSLVPDAYVFMPKDRALVLITNLVLNAIQHSSAGARVDITISRSQQKIQLQVQDYGSGISAPALPHVFERFYRADASRARETGGAGLGLAICKSIVDRAGGALDIVSAPQRGTVVLATFSLA